MGRNKNLAKKRKLFINRKDHRCRCCCLAPHFQTSALGHALADLALVLVVAAARAGAPESGMDCQKSPTPATGKPAVEELHCLWGCTWTEKLSSRHCQSRLHRHCLPRECMYIACRLETLKRSNSYHRSKRSMFDPLLRPIC